MFPNKKEAEINAALQRFQLLLYGNYYIQFYCKTIIVNPNLILST